MLLTSQIYINKNIQQKKMEQFLYFLLKKVIFQPYNGGFSGFYYKFVVRNK